MSNAIKENEIKMFCEYMCSPVGLDEKAPLFSWILQDGQGHIREYRIEVVLREKNQIVWDGGEDRGRRRIGKSVCGYLRDTQGTFDYRKFVYQIRY